MVVRNQNRGELCKSAYFPCPSIYLRARTQIPSWTEGAVMRSGLFVLNTILPEKSNFKYSYAYVQYQIDFILLCQTG